MQEFITHGKECFDRDQFIIPSNRPYINKPYGGLWGCRYKPYSNSAWHEWCVSERFFTEALKSGFIYSIKEDSRLYIIDTYRDLEEITDRFPNDKDDLLFPNKTIDYVGIMKEYDAIYLTDRGQSVTRHSRPYSLYGWDVESILILNGDIIINDRKWQQREL